MPPPICRPKAAARAEHALCERQGGPGGESGGGEGGVGMGGGENGGADGPGTICSSTVGFVMLSTVTPTNELKAEASLVTFFRLSTRLETALAASTTIVTSTTTLPAETSSEMTSGATPTASARPFVKPSLASWSNASTVPATVTAIFTTVCLTLPGVSGGMSGIDGGGADGSNGGGAGGSEGDGGCVGAPSGRIGG